MDEVDVRLCGLLILNSRTPYRELADTLGLSLQAVHRRIQVMREQGVINGFPGGLSIGYVGPVVLYVFGTSSADNMDRVVADLHRDDRTYIVLVCARNYISLGALLKDHDQIEEYVDLVRRVAELTDLTVGLMSATHFGSNKVGWAQREQELSVLDYRIMRSLKEDARRPVEEVASELGISAATARRRLVRMMEMGAFTPSMDWRPSASGQTVAQLHLRLEEGADRNGLITDLTSRAGPHLFGAITFSNLPRFLLLVVWARSMRELGQLVALAEAGAGVEAASPNIIISESRFDTWIDKLVEERAKGRRPASLGIADLQSGD
ncbi:MAG: AsnC family transcriptional regulator [Methanomassiliicoccus sp.]|nr:AsnC family transcriptional regulator [Methanomassiliicoccus sp.]